MYEKIRIGNMKWATLIVFILFSIFIHALAGFSAVNWFDDNFDYRQEINVSNPSGVSLSNFPVYLNISYNTNMQADYDDLRFVAGSCFGSQTGYLDYEIEYFDVDVAVVWVEVPNLVASNTTLCMYYGNSSVSSGQTGSATWNSDYEIVFHMNSTGDDSTVNNNDVVSVVDSPTANNTFLGYGLTFDGNDAWSMQDNAFWEAEFFVRSHEIVFETGSDVNSRQTLFAEGGGKNGVMMYILNGKLYARWWSETNPNWGGNNITVDISSNTVYHAVMTFDEGGDYKLFLNGELILSLVTPDHIDAHSGNGGIAYTGGNNKDYHDGNFGPGEYFIGNIYEFRATSTELDANWIKMTSANIINHTDHTFYGVEDKYLPNLSLTIDEPPTAAILPHEQNNTFELNATISCLGKTDSTCGNISAYLNYNDSLSSFANVPQISSTPVWTSSLNPQSCNLFGGDSCSLTFVVNMTGELGSTYLLNVEGVSNVSDYENITTDNLTVFITKGNVVIFNMTNYDFGSFDKNSGDRIKTLQVISSLGDNTNIVVECQSGDCSTITDNFVDGSSLTEGNSLEFNFTCSDVSSGSYSAIYNITSTEFNGSSTISLSCNVNKIFGPISTLLIEPAEFSSNIVGQNKTFRINATVNCVGDCGNVSSYAIYKNVNGFNVSGTYLNHRRNIHINNNETTDLLNFPVYLNISYDANMQADFDDLRFVNGSCNLSGSNLLDYEIETFTASTNAHVWLELPEFNVGKNTVCMYYGNSSLSSGENPTGVWDSNYDGVWHFSETGVGDRTDSAGINDATPQSYEGDEATTGLLGGADFLDGTDDHLAIQNLNYGGVASESAFTVCSVVRSSSSNLQIIASFDRSEFWRLALKDDYGSNYVGWDTEASGIDDMMTLSDYADGSWHYICGWFNATASGDDKKIFVNGVEVLGINAHSGTALGTANTRYGYIGTGSEAGSFNGGSGPDNFLFGEIDELRISSFARSSQWINMSYQLMFNNEDYVSFGKEESYEIISTSDLDKPFWTTTQPKRCEPGEDGSCSFEWIVNASGDINTSWFAGVVAISNYSSIESSISNFTTINISDNIIPEVSILNPQNNSKIIGNGSVEFIFNISDDDLTLGCRVFVDSILRYTGVCSSGVNSSVNLTLDFGYHNVTVQVNDSNDNYVNSSFHYFYLIQDKWILVKKKIESINNNMFFIDINATNRLSNSSYNITVFDNIYENFAGGSFTPNFNISNVSNGFSYYGEWIGFETLLGYSQTAKINYSVSGIGDYYLGRNYILGVE